MRESHSGQYECRPSNCHGTNNTAVTLVVLDGESALARKQLQEIRTVNMQCIKEGCAAKNRDCWWQFHRVFRICCWECARSSASCKMDINIEAAGVEKLA